MMLSGGRVLTLGVVGALALGLASGCVEKSKRMTQADQEALKSIVSTQPPKPQHPLDVRFENKVRLLGYDLSEGPVAEGVPFKVTWYWRVDEPLGEGWKIFTHVADAKRESRINIDANREVRRLYPAAQWKKGDFITDLQEITLPANWDSDKAILYLGFWNGPHRLHVTKGTQDGENRAEALILEVKAESAGAAQPAVPRLVAARVSGALQLDGKLDEPEWQSAQPSGPFVNTMTGAAGAFDAQAKVLYDADNLYVGFQVADDDLRSTFTKSDEHLWEQDTVEVMLDPDGDAKNYFEIQVSPRGIVFDTRYDATRTPKPFGDMAWSSQTRAGVDVEGTLDDDKKDVGYAVEMAIPWAALRAGPTPVEPPAKGDTWRMNFFAMDARSGGQRAAGWSPPLVGDFHTLPRFGRVVFPTAPDGTGTVPMPKPVPVQAPTTTQ